MEKKLFTDLIAEAKKDRKKLHDLFKSVLACQQYELAAQLRDIERKEFPESQKIKSIKEKAWRMSDVLSLVGLDIDSGTCWLIAETLKAYDKNEGKLTKEDVAALHAKKKELFFYLI